MTDVEIATAVRTIVDGRDVDETARVAELSRAELVTRGLTRAEAHALVNDFVAEELARRASKSSALTKPPGLRAAVAAELTKGA